MVDYSETIEVYRIKVGINSKQIENVETYMYMYQRSRSFLTIVQGHSDFINFK